MAKIGPNIRNWLKQPKLADTTNIGQNRTKRLKLVKRAQNRTKLPKIDQKWPKLLQMAKLRKTVKIGQKWQKLSKKCLKLAKTAVMAKYD